MKITPWLITLIILAPSSFHLPQIALPVGTFYITIVEILIFVCVAVWLIRLPFQGIGAGGKRLFSKYVASLLVLYAVYITVGLFQRSPIAVLGDFRQYMPLVLYYPLMQALSGQEDMEKLRRALYVSLAVISLYIIVIFAFFRADLLAYSRRGKIDMESSRIFIDNGVFLFFAYLGYFIAALNSGRLRFSRRVFYASLIILNLLALLIMQMRTFWVMAALSLILSFFSIKGAAYKLKYAGMAAVAVLIVAVLIIIPMQVSNYRSKTVDSIKDRVASFSDLDKVGKHRVKRAESVGSIDTRIETAKHVMKKYIAPNWLFGLGFGGKIEMVNYLGAATEKKRIDNGYITLLAKFGVFGMLFYFSLTLKMIISLFRIMRHPKATEDDIYLARSFLCALIVMAAGSMGETVFVWEQACIVGFVVMLCEIEFLYRRLSSAPGSPEKQYAPA